MTPPIANPGRLAEDVAAGLDSADIAAVLLVLPDADERTLLNGVKALAPQVQGKGAALLLAERVDLVARAGADGAHLSGIDSFNAALAALKPDRIAGCGALTTRHDAMLAAEAGADYVMFGEPDANGRRPSFDAVLERVAWWAEVFEVPCVGCASAFPEIAALAQAGVDFVAVGDLIFDDPRGPGRALADAAHQLSVLEAAG